MATEIVVTDQHRIRVAAEGAVLFFVNFLEQHAGVVVHSGFQILEQIFLADVEQAQLEILACFRAKNHVAKSTP